MIEVFKTNVTTKTEAVRLLDEIHRRHSYCRANFDLSDCDHILRVEGVRDEGDICAILTLVRECGYHAEILPDDSDATEETGIGGGGVIAHSQIVG